MDRLQIPGAVPAEAAERMSDSGSDFTAAEEIRLDKRVDALLAHRLYEEPEYFGDLMAGAQSSFIDPDLQRALRNLDAMINGDEISRSAVLTALSNIQQTMKRAARETWADELRKQAEDELLRGEL